MEILIRNQKINIILNFNLVKFYDRATVKEKRTEEV